MKDIYQISLSNHDTIVVPMMQGDTNYKIEASTLESMKYKRASVDVNTISGNVLEIPMDKVAIDELNNTITFTVDEQTTALPGRYKAQIKIYSSSDPDKVLSYYPIILNVDESIKPINSPYETSVNTVRELVNEGYKFAESWAHGGTGKRKGEDTDNAKYYANLAKTAYQDITDTNEAVLSNRISALETGYTLNQIRLGTIKHGLGRYPCIQGFKGKYGAGIIVGGPAGGSEITHVNIHYICNDLDNVTLYADKHTLYDDNGATMEPDAINKVDDNHYTVTFKNGAVYSLQIILS